MGITPSIAKPLRKSPPLSADAFASLNDKGFLALPDMFEVAGAQNFFRALNSDRTFGAALFMSEEEWEASPKTHKNTNPHPKNNIMHRYQEHLRFIEESPDFNHMLSDMLGDDWYVYGKKLVCKLPESAIPLWVKKILSGKPVNTLGAFIKPEYRDVSYYYDVDIHQDILEWVRQPQDEKEHRLLFAYVYLGDVTEDNGPLSFMSGSHRFGATPYQHDIAQEPSSGKWRYRDPENGRELLCGLESLVGGAGHGALWHPCLLHGSHPIRNDRCRLAARYVLARGKKAEHCRLDDINAAIEGPLYREENFHPGTHANKDGSFNTRHNDFTADIKAN